VEKVVDMKDYYQTNKGRLLGIGGILILVGFGLYFARGQEVVLVLPIVGVVLFIAGIIYKPRKNTKNQTSSTL
jgi:membrane-bound ClpP family serine protease